MIREIENQFYPNWIFPTSTFENKTILKLINDTYEEKITSEEGFINTLMITAKIEKILYNWNQKENSNLKKRIPILNEAIKAHLKEKYYLSVSALIPQIEGLLKDAAKEVGLEGVICWKDLDDRCLENAVNAIMGKWKEEMGIKHELVDLLNENFSKVIAYLYKEYNSENGRINVLNRHGICHGIQTNFGNIKNSLRLILIIDRIIFFMADEK